MKNFLRFCPAFLLFVGIFSCSFEQWHLYGDKGINIKSAWEITKGSSDVNIAVIDGNFFPTLPVFSDCSERFQRFELTKTPTQLNIHHGTNVTSFISTCPNNVLNLDGINQKSKILMIEWGPGRIDTNNELFQWAIGEDICSSAKFLNCRGKNNNPADVINASFGSFYKTDSYLGRRRILPVIEKINQRGAILVAAAGNEAMSADRTFPNSLTGVISAGATTSDGVAAKFSNWGETVEILAPGRDVMTAQFWGPDLTNGTSFSSPIIAGVVSLMKSVYPALNWKSALYFLQSTAVSMSCSEYCSENYPSERRSICKRDCCKGDVQVCTPGRVDAGAAVAAAKKAETEGLPQVALVDSDKYLIRLSRLTTGVTGNFTLTNVGGKKGKFNITPENTNYGAFTPSSVNLNPGESKLIQINFPFAFKDTDELVIRVADENSGLLSTFTDEMILSAQVF